MKPFAPILVATAAVLATLAPGVAHAAVAGDDFDSPIEITSLPTYTTIDTTGTTRASDDPAPCNYDGEASTWLRYTAPADGLVRLTAKSTRQGPFFGVFTGTRGSLTEVPGTCTGISDTGDETFHVKAGVTYHVALIEYYPDQQGPVTVGMVSVKAAPNDDRAAATAITLPARINGDLERASAEPGEAPPSCDQAATQSLWYRYTASRTGFAAATTPYATISVHRADLSEVDCVAAGANAGAVFATTAGETYLIRVTASERNAGKFVLQLGTAAPLTPSIHSSSAEPSIHDEIAFTVSAGDPHKRNLVSGTVDLGDGRSVPYVPGETIWHRYAQDGEYTVSVTASTADGRTGTGSTTVKMSRTAR